MKKSCLDSLFLRCVPAAARGAARPAPTTAACAAAPTTAATPCALPFPQLPQLAAQDKEYRGGQSRDDDNVCHLHILLIVN